MHPARLTLALLLTVLLAACNLTGDGAGGGTIEDVRWILTSYRAAGATSPVPAGVTADATFKGGTVSGSGGCNSYSAACTVSGSKLTVGDITATLMACDGPRGEIEAAYFTALRGAASFTAAPGRLTLLDGAGTAVLSFAAAATAR